MKFDKKSLIVAGSTLAAVVAAPMASADSAAAITAAIASGTTLVGMIAPGVIGIAALMLGVGIAVAWLKK